MFWQAYMQRGRRFSIVLDIDVCVFDDLKRQRAFTNTFIKWHEHLQLQPWITSCDLICLKSDQKNIPQGPYCVGDCVCVNLPAWMYYMATKIG